MHPRNVIFPLLLLTGLSWAQSTNFSTGPQYLVTTNSPLLLRPISTPSLSLSQAQTPTPEAVVAEEAPALSTITNQTFLSEVYWGDHSTSEIESRRVSTPSLSLSQASTASTPVPEEVPTTAEPLPGLPAQSTNVIEISSGALPANLPPSIFNGGVTGLTNSESLRERGFGVPLGDVAAYWKSHKRGATRSFTNRDVERLHGG